MQITTPNLRALQTAYRTAYQEGFSALAAGASLDTYMSVAMDVPSTDAKDTFGWMNELPGLRPWVGDRIIHSLTAGDYAIANGPFEQTVSVNRMAILNDRHGTFTPRFRLMGDDARRHPNSIVWPAFNAGLTAKGYDGVAFFATTHPAKDAGGNAITWSNYQGSGGNPLWVLVDDSRMMKPIIRTVREDYRFVGRENPEDPNVFMKDEFLYGTSGYFGIGYGLPHLAYASKQVLDYGNFNAAMQAMMSVTLDFGKPAGVVPRKLFTGPANRSKALEVVKRSRDAAGADNINHNAVDVVIIPEMLGA